MNYALELLAHVRAEAEPLLLRNWQESALDHEGAPFEPDWERYLLLEERGAFKAVTARESGSLAGFAAFLVGSSLHSKRLRLASCDTIWLAPEHRRGLTGMRLLRAAEDALQADGVGKVVVSVKANGVGSLLARMGYRPAEQVFTRTLGEAHG